MQLSGKVSDSKDKYSLRNISNLSLLLLLPFAISCYVAWFNQTGRRIWSFKKRIKIFGKRTKFSYWHKAYYQENLSVHRQNKVLWEQNKILQRKQKDSSEETKNLEKQQKACQQNKALREEIKSLKGYEGYEWAFALKRKALQDEILAFWEKHKVFKDQLRALQEDNKPFRWRKKLFVKKNSPLSVSRNLQEGNMPLQIRKRPQDVRRKHSKNSTETSMNGIRYFKRRNNVIQVKNQVLWEILQQGWRV